MNLTEKILKDHLVDADTLPAAGELIKIKIDEAFTQDATGTMAMLQLEAMGVKRVKPLSVNFVDHSMLQVGFRNPDDPVTYAGDDYRVLWGQFTIYKGKHLAGDLKMSMTLDGNGETVLDSFVIPSPAAMALLGLAGLVGRRRR